MMKQNNKNLDLAKLPKGLNKKQFLALPEMKNTRTIFLWTGIVEIIAGVFSFYDHPSDCRYCSGNHRN